jgi:2-polyprenyl-6-methoxyphenol hydroxylase-like FAD-dependent oxidoreductase
VLVVGAGVGGLCLAQGLRRAGIDVRVFERDPTADARGQGYRLRIDEHGSSALARCLPDDLFRLFRATANPPYQPRGAVFNHHLEQIESWRANSRAAAPASCVANRRTMREVLLAGLGDAVRFDREVVEVAGGADGVRVTFRDGRMDDGDVLVGADGINSVVRRHLLPHAALHDTGLRAVYGHATLDARLSAVLPESLFGGSSPVLGPAGTTLAVGVYRPCLPPPRAAAAIAPYARLSRSPDYVKWTLVAPPESLGMPEAEMWTAPPARLHTAARRVTAGWHPALTDLVAVSDVPSLFVLAIRAALPVNAWPTGRITLLGDAIHATTPVGGTGANTALRDAALLAECLAEVGRDGGDPRPRLSRYEEQMLGYGFEAVRRSVRGAEHIFRAPVRVPG